MAMDGAAVIRDMINLIHMDQQNESIESQVYPTLSTELSLIDSPTCYSFFQSLGEKKLML